MSNSKKNFENTIEIACVRARETCPPPHYPASGLANRSTGSGSPTFSAVLPMCSGVPKLCASSQAAGSHAVACVVSVAPVAARFQESVAVFGT